MRILLIEDNAQFATALTSGLCAQNSNYEVTHCLTLHSAAARLKTDSFDSALIDLHLPDAHGTDVATTVKSLAPQLPVVALTGEDFEKLGHDLLRLGIQDFLQKGDVSLLRIDQCLRMACVRQEREEDLIRQAAYDPLTGLANRKELHVQLRKALGNAERNNLTVAVVAIDLDGFKNVNDTHGHGAGDIVLKQVANRILRSVRIGDCVARIGGDEFMVVLESIKDLGDVTKIASMISKLLAEPVYCNKLPLQVTASIGISLFPEHSNDQKELCVMADSAMYLAKRNQSGSIEVYDPSSFGPGLFD